MDVVINENVKEIVLRVGDIVHSKNFGFYLVIKDSKGFIARSIKDSTGLSGHSDTLEGLKRSFNNIGEECIVYSKDKYQLELVKK